MGAPIPKKPSIHPKPDVMRKLDISTKPDIPKKPDREDGIFLSYNDLLKRLIFLNETNSASDDSLLHSVYDSDQIDTLENCWWGILRYMIEPKKGGEIVDDLLSKRYLFDKRYNLLYNTGFPSVEGDIDTFSRQSTADGTLSTTNNCLYGILLHMTGHEKLARDVVQSLRDACKGQVKLMRQDGLLHDSICCMNSDYSEPLLPNRGAVTLSNSLWGILLNTVGYKEEADRVVKTMMSLQGNQYRSCGLLGMSTSEDNQIGQIPFEDLIDLTYNSFWGMLLYNTGHKADADRAVRTIKICLDRSGGIKYPEVQAFAHHVPENKKILGGSCPAWGLLLHTVGDREGAKRIIRYIFDYQTMDQPATAGMIGCLYAAVAKDKKLFSK